MSTFDPNAASTADSGIFGLPHGPDEARTLLVSVPFEATTSYGGGTAEGPSAILSASRQVDLFDIEVGKPYEAGIAMLEIPEAVRALNREAAALARPIIDRGGVDEQSALPRVDALCERMNAWVKETVAQGLAAGKTVGTLGGDHSVAFGAIAAHAERFPGMGICHVDAHADLRRAYEGFTWSHASIFHNVMERIPEVSRLVQVGIRDLCEEEHTRIVESDGRIRTHFDALLSARRFEGETWAAQASRIVSDLPAQVYFSIDIDGLEPTLCPHTGTPVPGGLGFAQLTALFAAVVRSGRRIVGFDLTEVAPGPDGDEWDGNVAARLLYKLIGWTSISCSERSGS